MAAAYNPASRSTLAISVGEAQDAAASDPTQLVVAAAASPAVAPAPAGPAWSAAAAGGDGLQEGLRQLPPRQVARQEVHAGAVGVLAARWRRQPGQECCGWLRSTADLAEDPDPVDKGPLEQQLVFADGLQVLVVAGGGGAGRSLGRRRSCCLTRVGSPSRLVKPLSLRRVS